MRLLAIALIVLLAKPAYAEPTPLKWEKRRPIADHLSDALVATQVAAQVTSDWREYGPRRALRNLAVCGAATYAVSNVVKRLVGRERPDGSNNHSFPSGHTWLAAMNSGWRVEFGVPLTVGVGYLRMAAGKHYLTDVLVGAGAGVLTRKLCRGVENEQSD